MDKNKICEAMYALPGNIVVKRRKSLLVSIVLTLAGAAMLIGNSTSGVSLSNDLRSAVVFIGGSLIIAGVVMLLVRLFGSDGVPFHAGAHSFLRYDELYFERGCRAEVLQHVSQGAVEPLLAMPRSQVPALAVAVYRTADNRFAAVQAFEYSELEYKPLSELKIVGA